MKYKNRDFVNDCILQLFGKHVILLKNELLHCWKHIMRFITVFVWFFSAFMSAFESFVYWYNQVSGKELVNGCQNVSVCLVFSCCCYSFFLFLSH